MRFRGAAGLMAGVLAPLAPLALASVALFSGSPVLAQAVLAQSSQTQSPSSQPASPKQVKTYLHPISKYLLAVPVGAELAERGEAAQVSIRSRRGYIINIQTGDANPDLTLLQMVGKLEAQYLGAGKPWNRKIGSKPTKVAGLKAIENLYEGANTRVKVMIVRGMKTDFVIIFFAPAESFRKLVVDFDWFLANFKPNPADLMETAAAPGANRPPALDSALPKQFSRSGYGYTIQYPGTWEVATPSDDTATFSGKKGTDAFQVVVSIQNVRPPAAKTPAEATEKVLADLKASLTREATDFAIIGEKPLTYRNGDLSLAGRQMVVTYTYAGQRYRKWALVLPRPTGTVTHIWSYTAPDVRFKEFRPFADAMLKSWTIQPGSG